MISTLLIDSDSCVARVNDHPGGEPVPGISQGARATTHNHKRKVPELESEHQSQREPGGPPNQGSGSNSKRQKVATIKPEPKRVHPIVQTGMYAAEIFASHAGRQHVICLTIIGSRFSCPTRVKNLTCRRRGSPIRLALRSSPCNPMFCAKLH